jgi:hypothetical protein
MPKFPSEEIRTFLIDQVEGHPRDLVALAAEHFGVTRQAVHRHLAKLVEQGVVKASGSTRNKEYDLAEQVFSYELPLATTKNEDTVWRSYMEPVLKDVADNVLRICYYGFTEMLNNAIEHSEGTHVNVAASLSARNINLIISDNGIGALEKIKRQFHLEDHRHAILELSKGRLTTDPARHTGQGIFFTSRMFDEFTLFSGRLYFLHVRDEQDWFLEDSVEPVAGTRVQLTISRRSTLTPRAVFDQFADLESGDYDFSKTQVPLTLARYGKESLVSRSQAKRVLMGLERFKHVMLNFAGIDEIGQAFADEIFRVWKRDHPCIELIAVGANEEVTRMIRRAEAALRAEQGG